MWAAVSRESKDQCGRNRGSRRGRGNQGQWILKGHHKDLGLDSGWDREPELYFEQRSNTSCVLLPAYVKVTLAAALKQVWEGQGGRRG